MTQTPSAFALDLSNDGIFLWHRKPAQKWEFLGSVPLTSGNLRQQLEKLKLTAETIDPGPRSAIVRIPTAEVKTLSILDTPDAETSLEQRIVQTLEAAAQTTIRDLLFDIERGTDGSDYKVAWTHIDVVKQAETFVHLIGFTPSQYTTDVDSSAFPRRPNFQLHPDPVQQAPQEQTIQDPMEAEVTSAMAAFEEVYDDEPIHENLFQDDAAPVEDTEQSVETTPAKAEFGFLWFVALFLILGTIIAGIYLWPKIHKSAQYQNEISYDQPILASLSSDPFFSFEKPNLIL